MTRTNEKLLIGVLAGVIIAGAAAFAIGPALATSFGMQPQAQIVTPSSDVLNLRLSYKL